MRETTPIGDTCLREMTSPDMTPAGGFGFNFVEKIWKKKKRTEEEKARRETESSLLLVKVGSLLFKT